MKLPHTTVSRFWVLLLSVFTLASAAYAQKANVFYAPASIGIGGPVPFLQTYDVVITAPSALPLGSQWPITSTLSVSATGVPNPEVDPVVAASWVRLSTSSLTFERPSQSLTVSVTVDIPASALSLLVPSGTFTYLVRANDWPVGINSAGHRIEASVVTPREEEGVAPVVEITDPISCELSYPSDAFPVDVPFTFVATVVDGSPVITSVSAEMLSDSGTQVLAVTATGIDSRRVDGTGTFKVTGPGVYTLKCKAVNEVGDDVDEEDYTVTVQGQPPTVVINTPSRGQTFTYRVGDEEVNVPFTFTATSSYGGINSLTAKLDGNEVPFSPVGLGELTATGSVRLPYTTAGTHTIEVATASEYGTATDAGHFIINVVAPEPTITITAPYEGQEFTVPVGSTTVAVPYSFTTQVGNGFKIDSATATLGLTPQISTLVGLNTPTTIGTGTLQLSAGTYELTATGGSHGYTTTTKVTFSVKAAATPPTVVINSPANNYSVEVLPGGSVSVPFTFTGSSTTPGAVITQLTATLNGAPVAFTSSTLNTPEAVGNATLTFNAAGGHTLYVTATDAHGTAQATSTFTITAAEPRNVSGIVFFDVNANGTMDAADYGLAGVTVNLLNSSGGIVATVTSSSTGNYSFPGLFPANFSVRTTASAGFIASTATTVPVVMARENVTAAPIGYKLDLNAIRGMRANGFTIGYWKNNVEKAIADKRAQVAAAAIEAYTSSIAAFALAPFNGLTESDGVAIMGRDTSVAAELLQKQLLGSEYNYHNKAYLNGNGTLTYAFVYWGEFVLVNEASYSRDYVIWVKDWFDAYNNTHGGVVGGPN